MALDLTGLVAAAFLDAQGRFAKDPDLVRVVQLFWGDSPGTSTMLPVADFDALPLEQREAIRNTGSGAGRVVTEGKSNA